MHFSIPETIQAVDDNGSKFWNFHIHVNGVFHCKLRYSTLDKFYEQLKNDFPGRIAGKIFPGKKLFSLSAEQLEERREQLEKFIQYISQDPVVGVSDQFNDFFVKAQQLGFEVEAKTIELDIYLMNGNKVSIEVSTKDQTDDVLETAMKKIGLSAKFFYYFALFMVRKDEDGGISIVRKLQDFESPYLSLNAVEKPHRIIIRKNYWSAKYDEDLLEDRIAMNLLYVQIVDDLERGWMLCNEDERRKFEKLKSQGSRKEILKLCRNFKFYGYLHYRQCRSDYPEESSKVLVSSGDREFNVRVKEGNDKVTEGRFKVQRIRSWRLTSIPKAEGSSSEEEDSGETLQFAFEYLFAKDDLRWVVIESEQAIMMSMALQGIVDEILREKKGQGIREPRKKDRKSSNSSTASDTTMPSVATSSKQKSSDSNTKKTTNIRPVVHSGLQQQQPQTKVSRNSKKQKSAGVNEVFAEDIGDDDL